MRRVTLGLCVVVALFWLAFPIVWMLTTSIMSQQETLEGHLFPQQPTLDNYKLVLGLIQRVPYGNGLVGNFSGAIGAKFLWGIENSLVVGITVMSLSVVFGAPAAYALARLPVPFKRTLLYSYLGARLLPSIAIIVPLFLMFKTLGLIDSLPALIISQLAITLPITVWFLVAYLRGIPRDLDRSARADGCSELGVLWYVLAPVMRPGLVGAALIAFMSSWNDFFFVVILIADPQHLTVQPILAGGDFLPTYTLPLYGGLMAGAFLASLPPIALAIIFQRQLVRGLTSGAVVG